MNNENIKSKKDGINPDLAFGRILSKLIDRAGLTQSALAKQIGTTQPTISGLCNGRRQCGIGLATRISEHLKLSPEERTNFIRHARKPKWKGFDDALFGGEALLIDVILRAIKAAGVEPLKIESATEITPADPQGPRAILVMKDGNVADIHIQVIPRPVAYGYSSVPTPVQPPPSPSSEAPSVQPEKEENLDQPVQPEPSSSESPSPKLDEAWPPG